MQSRSVLGAAAAAICGTTYVVGFALLVTVLRDLGFGGAAVDPTRIVAFHVAHPSILPVWNLTIYVLNGLSLAGLAVILGDGLRRTGPVLAQMVQGVGLMWATLVVGAGMIAVVGLDAVAEVHRADPEAAAQLWQVLHVVEIGLGGGTEIVGGVWAMLVGLALWRAGLRPLAMFSGAIGLSGLLTLIPVLGETPGAVFGLGYIAWFFWVARVLLRLPYSG